MDICLPGECVPGFYYSNERRSKALKCVLDSKSQWSVWVLSLEFLCVFFISNAVGFSLHRPSNKGKTSSWNVDRARGFLSISDSLPPKHEKSKICKGRVFLFVIWAAPCQMTHPFGLWILVFSHFFFLPFVCICFGEVWFFFFFSFVSHLTWQNTAKNTSQL